jgi:hypothetical protein
MNHRVVLVLLLVALLPGMALAVPTGTAASLVGNQNVTFTADNGAGTAWFQYGLTSSTLNVWTQEQEAAGTFEWTEVGSPLTATKTYWVAGCDTTGCDTSPAQFTMGNITPLPTTTYGYLITNATKNRFNMIMFLPNIPLPYTWLFPANARALALSIVTALTLFAIFYGYATRTRGTAIVVVLGIIVTPYLLYANQGMNLGVPVEFQGIAQGIFYACIAGLLLIILRK